ncbi:MAG: aminotransferase class V-fold PLP-dependent enzyme [Chitinophagaceae bacterium]|nr:MAG: aminotransferase class V-fold PLP-dependent enzyme [Chitinophagaceae bacterium]
MYQNRKSFLKKMGSGLLLAASTSGISLSSKKYFAPFDAKDFEGSGDSTDEKYWRHISKKYYDVSDSFINLENGYFGVQAKPVMQAFLENTALLNKELSKFARLDYPELFTVVKKQVAAFLQVADDEIIITRNATEAMNIAIQGYPFKDADEVILSQLDYPSVIETFQMLEKRGRLKIKTIELPLLPKTDDEIVEIYRQAISSKTKVILLTQVSNFNGLIIPVKKIATMAKAKGIDTITDAAHALGHIPFSLPELQTDFVGMNLHKWIGNPIGVGVLYVKKERQSLLQPLFGDVLINENNIAKLSHFGTTNFAINMTIPASFAFHKLMDVEKISKRLHYLKSIWVNEFQNHSTVEVITPVEPDLSCAIASFRIKNKNTADIASYLFKQHRVFTVNRVFDVNRCIRVTPAVYNSSDDIKKLVMGIKDFA